jgi:hypothetical protein
MRGPKEQMTVLFSAGDVATEEEEVLVKKVALDLVAKLGVTRTNYHTRIRPAIRIMWATPNRG